MTDSPRREHLANGRDSERTRWRRGQRAQYLESSRKSEPFHVQNDDGHPVGPVGAKRPILAGLNCGINAGSSFCEAQGADHRFCPDGDRQEGRFDVLTVGQLRPYKGLEVLLRAFRNLPEAHLHVVGDGHRRKHFEALAARLELPSVRFYGSVSDSELCRLYAASHVAVLSSVSRMEAFGMSLLEAMMTGCVLVASKLPGVAEVVGDAGKLVPPGNADELAKALRGLQLDRALRERLSVRARRRAAAFRWEETAARYLALFEEFSGKRSSHEIRADALPPRK